MNYSSRVFLYAPVSIFMVLALAAGVRWWVKADEFSRRLDALNGHAAMPGVTVSFKAKAIGGFPFRIDATFTGLRISVATSNGPITWSSQEFALHRLTYGRAQDILEAAGRQQLTWRDDKGVAHALDFLPALMHASAIDDDRGLARFDLDIAGASSPDFTAIRMQLHVRRDPVHGALDLDISADELRLSKPSIFGPRIAMLRLDATIGDADAFTALRAGLANWQTALEHWRALGGAMRIDEAALDAGDARLRATGRLDARGAPKGTLLLQASGLSALPGDSPLVAALRSQPQGKPIALTLAEGRIAITAPPSSR